jgi:hypothetical protein
MMTRLLACAALAAALPLHAADFPNAASLVQGEFRGLSEDLGAAFAYKGVTPATALGTLGFDIGIEVTDTKVENSSAFRRAGADADSHIVVPKLHVHKGLPGGFDIGAFIGGATEVDATLYGAELRYAILQDGLTTPAVGARLSGTKATGLGDLEVSTLALDAMISKRFTLVTPYAGAGIVRVQSRLKGSSLAEERFNQSRYFLGVNLNLLAANFAIEAEKMGDNNSISAKIGFRF